MLVFHEVKTSAEATTFLYVGRGQKMSHKMLSTALVSKSFHVHKKIERKHPMMAYKADHHRLSEFVMKIVFFTLVASVAAQFPGFPFQPYPGVPFPQPAPQHDVCDFESAVLVDMQIGSQGSQGADGKLTKYPQLARPKSRIMCADVAVLDEKSCTSCCRLAVALPHVKIPKDKITGILVDTFDLDEEDEIFPGHPSEGYRKDRVKRSVGRYRGSKKARRFNEDIKCMCCHPQLAPVQKSPFQQFPFPQPYPQFGR
uniref:DUF3330 domain-containing protein n=1 Tax=Steinernema glaseri TaxID=37863 RepID=A0A1I8AL61_9BILA